MIDVHAVSVTVMVSDLDRSEAFYRDRLGFSVLYRADEHFAMLERQGFLLGLHPGGDPDGGAPGMSIGLSVPDIGEAMDSLGDDGISFPGGIVEDGPIKRADFEDPDGTRLYLVQQSGS